MLLTITNERPPGTDLGYLLHKSPERLHSFSLAYGKAHIFYPEATDERCTFALLSSKRSQPGRCGTKIIVSSGREHNSKNGQRASEAGLDIL